MKRVRICDRRYYPVLEKSVLHAERVIKRMRRNDVARDSELEGMALNGSGGGGVESCRVGKGGGNKRGIKLRMQADATRA